MAEPRLPTCREVDRYVFETFRASPEWRWNEALAAAGGDELVAWRYELQWLKETGLEEQFFSQLGSVLRILDEALAPAIAAGQFDVEILRFGAS